MILDYENLNTDLCIEELKLPSAVHLRPHCRRSSVKICEKKNAGIC